LPRLEALLKRQRLDVLVPLPVTKSNAASKGEEEEEEGSGETKEGVIADICDHIVSSLNKDERYYQQPFLKYLRPPPLDVTGRS
jgi:hypothetical protein